MQKTIHTPIKNESYKVLVQSFENWLDILGYSESTIKNLPSHLREFLHYLENHHINQINALTHQQIKDYYHHLQTRENQMREGGLSKAYLNKHIQALIKFNDYLKEHNAKPLPIHLKREEQDHRDSLQILTQEEVKQLFKATDYSSEQERIRKRDKVILVLLYSCGLRRNEVVNLKIKDVVFDKERIHIRKGKNYKERYVPVNEYNLKIIEEYIYDYRPSFYNYKQTEYLLINYRGKPLQGQSLSNRLNEIANTTQNKSIIEKQITPHILRHSIATHLLEKGAKIETISQFLGHSSLESTQIYTHLLEHKAKTNQDEELHNLLREKRLQQQEYSNIPKGYRPPKYMDE